MLVDVCVNHLPEEVTLEASFLKLQWGAGLPLTSHFWQHQVDYQLLQLVHPSPVEVDLAGGCTDTTVCFLQPFLQLSQNHIFAQTGKHI